MKWILLICCIFLATGCNEKNEPKTKSNETNQENVNQNTVEEDLNQSIIETEKILHEDVTEQPNHEQVVETAPGASVALSIDSFESTESVTTDDEQMIAYTESVEQEVMVMMSEEEETFKEKVADKFIEVVDFIYYDAPINGIYFKDLTESAQNKIKSVALRIDNAIESKIPNYKETLKEKYQIAIAYIKEKANVISEATQEKLETALGSENYQSLVDAKDDMKESFQNAAEVISEGASEIYQSGKEKVSNWYQGLKEKYAE